MSIYCRKPGFCNISQVSDFQPAWALLALKKVLVGVGKRTQVNLKAPATSLFLLLLFLLDGDHHELPLLLTTVITANSIIWGLQQHYYYS